MCAVFLRDALARMEGSGRAVLGACEEGEALEKQGALLQRLAGYKPLNTVSLRRTVASRLLAKNHYVI
jgi:hypothetical protein